MKKITFALAAILALSVTGARAQDKIEGTIGADVVSRYYWRGQALGDAAIQPTLGLSWKGLSLTAWGSYGFVDKDDTKEFDLTLAYSTGVPPSTENLSRMPSTSSMELTKPPTSGKPI